VPAIRSGLSQRLEERPTMLRTNLRARLRSEAIELLRLNPNGLRFSEMLRLILASHEDLKSKTIEGALWNLDRIAHDQVYKPVKGLYRLLRFKEPSDSTLDRSDIKNECNRIKEEEFYPLFAAWLRDDLEDVTHAIPLGGNAFRDRWGTPDVIGKNESRRSDVIKGPTSIVSAEIKVDTAGLVIGFGQACAYRLFSHKSYLVIPKQTPAEELARIDSLCQLFGLGLVLFNPKSLAVPDFRLVVHPRKHEPDLFYTNRYIKHVEKELFS
jgi:hypothetical protein